MIQAPLPYNEDARLVALQATGLLDSGAEAPFDDIARLAAHVCRTPIALVSLIDAQRQWFKARHGLETIETPRSVAFCAHAILEPRKALVVEDALADERFTDNPLVAGEPNLRFYAGVPLTDQEGNALGTLCVIDHEPRKLDDEQLEFLRSLARQAMQLIELRKAMVENTRATERHAELERARQQAQTRLELVNSVLSDHERTRSRSMLVRDVVARLRVAFPGLRAAYWSLSATGMRECVALSAPPTMSDVHGAPLDLLESADYLAQLRSGAPVIVYDIERDPIPTALLDSRRAAGVRSVLEIAIHPASGTLGILGLAAARPRLWSEHEIALLHDVGVALEILLARAEHEAANHAQVDELAAREERWRSTCEARKLGSIDWRVASGELIVSQCGAELLGLPEEELRTTNADWSERLHPQDRDRWLGLAARDTTNSDAVRVVELRVRGAADAWRRVVAHVRIVRDASGDAVRIVGSLEAANVPEGVGCSGCTRPACA